MNDTRPIALALLVLGAAGVARAGEQPVAVSPGGVSSLALIEDLCPTFSWGEVEEAISYELVVYRLGDQKEAEPVLLQGFSGSVESWTPSLERCLEPAGKYAWSVRATDTEGPSHWSAPRLFEVVAPTTDEFQEALAVVRDYLAARGEARAPRAESPEPQADAKLNSRRTKSAVRSQPQATSPTVLSVDQGVAAASFAGDGSALTNLDPTSLTAGTAGIDISGMASTAGALASNPVNCPAGQAPTGVSETGIGEGCFEVATLSGNSFGGNQIVTVSSGDAISGTTSDTSGRAVVGIATATTGPTFGGYFQSDSSSNNPKAVFGHATASTGNTYGVYGVSDSDSGRGVTGIATAATGATYGGYFRSYGTNSRGVDAWALASTGTTYGVLGRNSSTDGYGIFGLADSTTGTNYGVYGKSSSGSGTGVYGTATAAGGTGVYGTGSTYGVIGQGNQVGGYFLSTNSGQGKALVAMDSTGTNEILTVRSWGNVGLGKEWPAYKLDVEGGQINASDGLCIAGDCRTDWDSVGGGGDITAVLAGTGLTGGGYTAQVALSFDEAYGDGRYSALVHGHDISAITNAPTLGANSFTGSQDVNVTSGNAVTGTTSGAAGQGVYGYASASSGTSYGVYGQSDSTGGYGVYGSADASSGTNYGVYGTTSSADGYAVYAYSNSLGGTAVRAYAIGSGNLAGDFYGDVGVVGTFSASNKLFKIDHPIDPANKYLHHVSIESPEMMNVYNGNVVLDENGEAWVELPDYFEALNRDFRYQLTAIGAPGPDLYVAQEIKSNRFRIAGGNAGMKVSWQVTGLRHDPYALAHPVEVEQDKPADQRGLYLHPEAYGQPEQMGIAYADRPKALQ